MTEPQASVTQDPEIKVFRQKLIAHMGYEDLFILDHDILADDWEPVPDWNKIANLDFFFKDGKLVKVEVLP